MPEIQHRHAADQEIAQDAEPVRHIAEDEEAQQGGEDDLGVVIDGDLFGRGTAVGRRDTELAAGGKQSGPQQNERLLYRHGSVDHQHIGQRYQAGKG